MSQERAKTSQNEPEKRANGSPVRSSRRCLQGLPLRRGCRGGPRLRAACFSRITSGAGADEEPAATVAATPLLTGEVEEADLEDDDEDATRSTLLLLAVPVTGSGAELGRAPFPRVRKPRAQVPLSGGATAAEVEFLQLVAVPEALDEDDKDDGLDGPGPVVGRGTALATVEELASTVDDEARDDASGDGARDPGLVVATGAVSATGLASRLLSEPAGRRLREGDEPEEGADTDGADENDDVAECAEGLGDGWADGAEANDPGDDDGTRGLLIDDLGEGVEGVESHGGTRTNPSGSWRSCGALRTRMRLGDTSTGGVTGRFFAWRRFGKVTQGLERNPEKTFPYAVAAPKWKLYASAH